MRIGFGYDVHRFDKNRKLILGGVEIGYELGLLGHSDADVLCHAIMDSILGACALGDIGTHFPDTDEKYKDISSIILLKECMCLLRRSGYDIINIDATVVAQQPKLAPHIFKIRESIANAMQLNIDCVSVKATTEESLGFTGSLEGIKCYCVSLIEKSMRSAYENL